VVADDDVEGWLGEALGGSITSLRRLSGGASRVTSSFELTVAGASTRSLILQVDRGGGGGVATGVHVEADLLRSAKSAGVPVADVVGAGVLQESGRGWLVVNRIDGETIARKILRDDDWASARTKLTEQCGEALAAIHRIDPASIDGLPRHDPLSQPVAYLDGLGEVRPVLELGARWLAVHPVDSSLETTVHGDFRLGNLLIGPEGLRAVLDWELAHAGDAAEDLGWLCARAWRFGGAGRVGGFGDLDELLSTYSNAGGAHISPEQVRWWEVFASVKWAVICALQASAHLSGASRSAELAAIGRRVCESEWDVLLALGLADKSSMADATSSASSAVAPFGRPTSAELLEAVREQLESTSATDHDARQRFQDRVAANALGIVQREMALGASIVAQHASRLASLGFGDDLQLALALRDGGLDGDLDRVGRELSISTYQELLVSNPTYVVGSFGSD
jgi:aminoglycoside phosphotransferase (APT) family kinase protein